MFRKHLLHSFAGLFALASSTTVFARGQFWDFLGDAQVDTSQDHGRIQITRRDGHFRTIQLRVNGEAIFLDRLVVHFADGTSQELMISGRISPEGGNYVINLLGERSLESIDLWYYKEPQGHTPRVTLYGAPSPQGDDRNIAQEQ
jgi:hypothetical protein